MHAKRLNFASASARPGLFPEDLVNHFSELAVRRGRLGFPFSGFNLRLQIQHERLQPLAAGLKFFDGHFQFPDFLAQTGGDFGLVHGAPLNQLGRQIQAETQGAVAAPVMGLAGAIRFSL